MISIPDKIKYFEKFWKTPPPLLQRPCYIYSKTKYIFQTICSLLHIIQIIICWCGTTIYSMTNSVRPPLVTSCTKLPFLGRSSQLSDQLNTRSATNVKGVQEVVSALGIHFRFIGVSNVTGNNANTYIIIEWKVLYDIFLCLV